jgi:hypothetical protein
MLEDVTPAAASMRVSIDPATGRLSVPQPGAAGLAPLWSLARMPAVMPAVVQLVDGSLMVDLSGIFLTSAVASIGWDGHPTLGCVDFGVDPEEYLRSLSLVTPPARAKVRE